MKPGHTDPLSLAQAVAASLLLGADFLTFGTPPPFPHPLV